MFFQLPAKLLHFPYQTEQISKGKINLPMESFKNGSANSPQILQANHQAVTPSTLSPIDAFAEHSLSILGSKSAIYRIQLPERMLHLGIWIGLTLSGILLPQYWGLFIFTLGIFNYCILLRFRLVNFFLKKSAPTVSLPTELDKWPSFSIIFPVKNENEVIHETLRAIENVEYPKELIQVIIVVEQTDQVTQASLDKIELPAYFEKLYIPELPPFTKGRALLHALHVAKGEYITVYDAESRPESQQLRKAALALLNAEEEICCQAKIQISNRHFNWLTRNFAGEYFEWYEQHLAELSTAGLPFGLGGNSFFVAKKALVDAGSWDPFNVTEDADLSVRLVQKGVRLRILDSYTAETCPEFTINWVNQRTRWNKGLFITQLVHLRKTLFSPAFKFRAWLSFWLRMVCASALPFFNLYIVLYMLFAHLSDVQVFTFSLLLWFLLLVNLLTSWVININTYRRLSIHLSIFAIFWDSFRYLFLHIFAGYKSYWEYFVAPLQWNKTDH